ncbi:MAG: hypothetical protein K5829_04970 [Treponema sp.]|nr:hypothetical protein [Treponema sp.]
MSCMSAKNASEERKENFPLKTYQEIFESKKNRHDLFEDCRSMFIDSYINSGDKLSTKSDKSMISLKVGESFSWGWGNVADFSYTVIIEIKDNRLRLTFTDAVIYDRTGGWFLGNHEKDVSGAGSEIREKCSQAYVSDYKRIYKKVSDIAKGISYDW